MCIWCSAVVLFTCTLVLSRQSARKGLSAKYEPLEQTARYWVGQSKQEYTWGKRTNKRHSLTLDRGHEGRINEVLQEDGRSSMYRTIIVWLPVWKKLATNFYNMQPVCCYDYLVSSNWIAILTDVNFHRLKMNHDSHEFILESGTIANTYICYCDLEHQHSSCRTVKYRYNLVQRYKRVKNSYAYL
jgi:hypothetical protein